MIFTGHAAVNWLCFYLVLLFILLCFKGILNINALLLQSLHLLRLLYDFGAVGSQCKTLQIVYNSVVCIIDESYVVLSCCSLCFRAARFVVAAVAPCHFMYALYVQQVTHFTELVLASMISDACQTGQFSYFKV